MWIVANRQLFCGLPSCAALSVMIESIKEEEEWTRCVESKAAMSKPKPIEAIVLKSHALRSMRCNAMQQGQAQANEQEEHHHHHHLHHLGATAGVG